MAQFTVNASRCDPYKNFKFRVKWDGRYVAGVSKIGASRRSTELVEHREGGDPSTSRKSSGRTKFDAPTLEREVTHDREFERWANKVWNFGSGLGAEASLARSDLQANGNAVLSRGVRSRTLLHFPPTRSQLTRQSLEVPRDPRDRGWVARVDIAGLGKRFGETVALHLTDLAIEAGEFVVIVGPSGCGKSTLLRLIAGLEEPSSGTLAIDGRDVTRAAPADRGLAMVFQSYALYPHLTVAENIGYPLKVAGRPKREIAERVAKVAASLDLDALLARRPRALSGGQRQRVSIARAIIREPRVLLLDEPLSNLDAALRVRMRHEFARLHQTLGATMIYVTHDQLEAMTLANRIVVMAHGRVEQVGAPMELYHRPASLAVARAIGSPGINLMPATVVGGEAGRTRVRLADGAELDVAARVPAGAMPKVTLGIRPEHLHPADDGAFAGPVELFERLGPLSFAHLGTNGHGGVPVVAQLPGDRAVTLGERLRFAVDPADARLFGADGRAIP